MWLFAKVYLQKKQPCIREKYKSIIFPIFKCHTKKNTAMPKVSSKINLTKSWRNIGRIKWKKTAYLLFLVFPQWTSNSLEWIKQHIQVQSLETMFLILWTQQGFINLSYTVLSHFWASFPKKLRYSHSVYFS